MRPIARRGYDEYATVAAVLKLQGRRAAADKVADPTKRDISP
jgi:hypothetical protein